jgi:hypothetical protein
MTILLHSCWYTRDKIQCAFISLELDFIPNLILSNGIIDSMLLDSSLRSHSKISRNSD